MYNHLALAQANSNCNSTTSKNIHHYCICDSGCHKPRGTHGFNSIYPLALKKGSTNVKGSIAYQSVQAVASQVQVSTTTSTQPSAMFTSSKLQSPLQVLEQEDYSRASSFMTPTSEEPIETGEEVSTFRELLQKLSSFHPRLGSGRTLQTPTLTTGEGGQTTLHQTTHGVLPIIPANGPG